MSEPLVKVHTLETMTPEQTAEYEARQLAWEAGKEARQAEAVRAERDLLLKNTSWLVERHLEQLVLGETTLSPEQYTALLQYRQALRDVPQQGDIFNVVWPTNPLE